MNFNNYIIEFLEENGKVAIPSLGEFSLKNVQATVNVDQKSILPPGKEIFFQPNPNLHDDSLAEFISKKENLSKFEAELRIMKLKNDIDYHLDKCETFELEKIGKFFRDNSELKFHGNRILKGNPDYYGLEQIDLDVLHQKKSVLPTENVENSENYKFNNSILWIFLLLVPVLGLLYLGITQSERLFGKKSFDDLSVKTSTHRIEKDTVKKDTLKSQKVSENIKK